ncbi:hypothetical protein GH714_037831 [Hevea brasiliensis]|uniref:Uncharacterized protein n=1 Tax=Hevea brasiliensis TaxID=3981 RepID=A0A6A6LX53_HEVBR|nr:hypothetical protein GH714_037831 [Hevea brasiliensis]
MDLGARSCSTVAEAFKKLRPMRLIRLALYMLKLSKASKSKSDPVNETSRWKKFVGSMRPLHLQRHQSPPRIMEATPTPSAIISAGEHPEVYKAPISPAYTSATSSSNGMSQYESATSLQELDQLDKSEENDEDNGFDNKGGDEMIDVKAEQFIAQFYQQMRLQNETYKKTRK